MDPIIFPALSMVVAISLRLGCFVADLEAAGDEFTDVIQVLDSTISTVKLLESLLSDSASLSAERDEMYARRLRLLQNDLDDIGTLIQRCTTNLNRRGFFSRTKQKTLLAHGELQRHVNRLNSFNQSVQTMILMHSSEVLSRVHDDTRDIRKGVGMVKKGVGMDLGVRYGSDAMKALMYDDWDHGGMDFVAGDGGSENRHTNAGTPDGLPSLPETPHTPLAPPRPPPSPSPSWSTLPEPCYSGLQEHYKPLEPRNGTPSSTIRGSTSSHSLFVSSSIPSRISLPQRPSVYPQQPVVRVDPGVVRQETDETWTAVAMHSPWSSGVFPPSLASTSPPPYEYRSGDVDLGMPELESTSTSRGGQDLQEYARTFSELQRDDW